jgi:AraC-type transcriptional regulator N-terminus
MPDIKVIIALETDIFFACAMSKVQHVPEDFEMMNEAETKEKGKLVKLLGDLALKEGVSPSNLTGVQFIRYNKPFRRMPVVYEPSIVIVGQGKKIGYLGDQVYTYDPFNYLVLSVPLPFECETLATPE